MKNIIYGTDAPSSNSSTGAASNSTSNKNASTEKTDEEKAQDKQNAAAAAAVNELNNERDTHVKAAIKIAENAANGKSNLDTTTTIDNRQLRTNTFEDLDKRLKVIKSTEDDDYKIIGKSWKKSDALKDSASDLTGNTSGANTETFSSAFSSIDSEVGLQLELPNWGYANFINERNSWQKTLHSISGERGWFYFKIFFKFTTGYGLFGNIMYDNSGPYIYNPTLVSTTGSEKTMSAPTNNSAVRYLSLIASRYEKSYICDRLLALYKFTGILSFINCEAPWFFQSVSNLDKVANPYIDTDQFTKDKYIDITCLEDAVDMRLGMLFDLYKYACYDSVNCKEIIPENLRKFDMSIAVFGAPIRYFQTGMMGNSLKTAQFGSNSKTVLNKVMGALSSVSPTYAKYKSLSPGASQDFGELMSFQLFQFKNCEFDPSTFGGYYQNLSNEKGFTLGKNTIRINFDRCFKYNMNEWNETLFGPDKFYYDNTELPATYPNMSTTKSYISSHKANVSEKWKKRVDAIRNSYGSQVFQPEINRDQYKALIDFGEYAVTDCLITDKMTDHYGNMYNPDGQKGNVYGYNSDYFKNKLKWLKQGMITGNIFGYVQSTQSNYFKSKLDMLHTSCLSGNLYSRSNTDITNINSTVGAKQAKLDELFKSESDTNKLHISEAAQTELNMGYYKDNRNAIKKLGDSIKNFFKW